MAKVLTFTIQKGGCGKTTTTGIVAYLMAQEGHRVLVVDMDSQGNATDFLTDLEPEDIEGESILEAFEEMDAKKYVKPGKVKNIDVLPADDYLALWTEWLYTKFIPAGGTKSLALIELLAPLADDYDYILIDTPPSLGEYTINAICASDYAVVLAESSKWAFTAIPRLIKMASLAGEQLGETIGIAGILRTMNDVRRYDSKAFVELIGERYPDLVFDTVIKRKAATGRLAVEGFEDNKELKDALELYHPFYEELKNRLGVTVNV